MVYHPDSTPSRPLLAPDQRNKDEHCTRDAKDALETTVARDNTNSFNYLQYRVVKKVEQSSNYHIDATTYMRNAPVALTDYAGYEEMCGLKGLQPEGPSLTLHLSLTRLSPSSHCSYPLPLPLFPLSLIHI